MVDKTPKTAAFDINAPVNQGKAAARLPMYGVRPQGALDTQFPIDGVDAYLGAMHAQMGDVANAAKDYLIEAAKALGTAPPQAFSYSSMAFMPDPGNLGLMQWPGLNPESLRKIARENIAPTIITRSRVADLARYSGLSTHPWKPGWRITLRDASRTPSEQDRKDIRAAERFIWNCSRDMGFEDARERDARMIHPFEMFLRSFGDDTHTFDGWSIWTDMDNADRVNAFANLPAGMIRLALPTRGVRGNRDHYAALVDETGTPVKPFTRKEMTWRIRNISTDPGQMGYGTPEIQMAVRLIQGFQSAIDLNVSTFTQNSIPNGMLLLKGDYFNQDQIDALMREWTNMKRGMSKVWGMPVMAVPDGGGVEVIEFMDLKGQEVRYKDHMNMMMGCCCLVYQFPVRRLGMFVSGHGKDNQPLSDAATETQGADDPGLPPLLIFAENTINSYLLWPNWKHLQFEFVSKNPKEDARGFEARKLARTWKESRAEADLPELSSICSPEMKPLMEIMEACPEDPSKAGVFQSVAAAFVEKMLGLDSGGEAKAKPGATMTSKKDPAESQSHGHLAGVRRDSAAEAASAAKKD